jgi:hypothetical protein
MTSGEGFFVLGLFGNSPAVFVDATDPLEADSWLRTIESKFRLFHYIEYQKTLYAAQQLRGTTRA